MKKVLIIRFSSIGDIVLTTPVIRCLKTQLKDVEVHYLTKQNFSSILENNPYITKIHTIKENVNEVIDTLKEENFDFIVDLHHNLRSLQIKRKLKKPSASFNKLNIEKFLMVWFKINKLPDIHIVDRYLATVKQLGVTNDGKGLDYFIPVKDEVNINTLPETHRNGYIGFVIGAAHATKQLPVAKIISICKKLNQPIILLGGKEDVEKGKEIKTAVGDLIFNACNLYNINQSASLVKQAQKIITHDTGLMHIAAAFQKPIVSVWGNTIPEFGMYVYKGTRGQETGDRRQETEDRIVEVKGLSCRPCSKIGYNKCPKGHFKCMIDIREEEVISAAQG
jgi:ADP-heptose:LPS heptosyltransferase